MTYARTNLYCLQIVDFPINLHYRRNSSSLSAIFSFAKKEREKITFDFLNFTRVTRITPRKITLRIKKKSEFIFDILIYIVFLEFTKLLIQIIHFLLCLFVWKAKCKYYNENDDSLIISNMS